MVSDERLEAIIDILPICGEVMDALAVLDLDEDIISLLNEVYESRKKAKAGDEP